MALASPTDDFPDNPGELSDFSTFTPEGADVLWEANSGGSLVYQLGNAPSGTNPAYFAKG